VGKGKRDLLRDIAKGDAHQDDLDQRVLYRYARAAYLSAGGDPQNLDDLPWRDIMDWLAIQDILDVRSSLGGLPDE